MHTEVLLHAASFSAVARWLDEFVAIAHAEQRRHPFRPTCPTMLVQEVDPYLLPLHARPTGDRVLGICTVVPSPADPFGEWPVTIGVTQLNPQNLHLKIECSRRFPMTLEELLWSLQQHFVAHLLSPSATAGSAPARLHSTPGSSSERGAPQLACNVWLEEELGRLENIYDYHHLFDAWLSAYYDLRGRYPSDPRRSFRAAAEKCIERLRRHRVKPARNGTNAETIGHRIGSAYRRPT